MDYLKKWLPYELKLEDGAWRLLWLYVGDLHFNEPFFDETISLLRIRKGGSRLVSSTSLETFMDLNLPQEAVPITSIIFHVSRCGSTLLSQALSVTKENIVVPEAPLFDQILRMNELNSDIPKDFIDKLLIKTIMWYGQNRTGSYERYFIKLDSWHIHFYEQMRHLFTDVPFYFLTREPLAIIKSHLKRRGIHAIPGYVNANLLGIKLGNHQFEDFNYYTEQVLTNFYLGNANALDGKHPLNHFFDYDLGVHQMLIDFYKSVLGETTVPGEVIARLAKHSKEPNETFKGDGSVDYQIKSAILIPTYAQLLKKITESKWEK